MLDQGQVLGTGGQGTVSVARIRRENVSAGVIVPDVLQVAVKHMENVQVTAAGVPTEIAVHNHINGHQHISRLHELE